MTQLCLAMADLILLMPEWNTALQELMTALGRKSEYNYIFNLFFIFVSSFVAGPPQPHTRTLLEVLLLLPEEVDSRHLRLGANRRQQVKDMLSGSSQYIIQFLGTVITTDQSQQAGIKQKELKCFPLKHSVNQRYAVL